MPFPAPNLQHQSPIIPALECTNASSNAIRDSFPQYDFESRLNYPPTQTASQRLNLETSTALFILLCLLQVFTSLPNSNSTKLITIFVPCLMNACRLCRVSVTSSQGCRLPNTTSELSSFRLSIKPEIFCT